MAGQTNFLTILHISTAGKQEEDLGSDETQIILMVYLVYDVVNNKIVAVQQSYVRPNSAEYSDTLLSDECKQSTDIDEEHVKNAKPLEQVLEELERFFEAKGIHPDNGGNFFYFCVFGPQPLRMVLFPEACRKQIRLNLYFNRYFDIRREFQKLYKRPTSSIDDMLEYLGIEPDQNIDFGMRKVQQIASIVKRLISDGHQFTNSEIINDRLEPGICHKSDTVDDDTVIRARGLPWQSSDADIAKFFTGLNIAKGGVALCLSLQGRRNGEALIRFDSKESRDLALRKHKHHLGNRYIEVYKATGKDFLNVAGGSNTEAQTFLSRGAQVIIRMRGLPYTATAEQVIMFFKSGENACDVLDGVEGVMFVHQPDGRATGDAFVLFATDEEANVALMKHRELIGSRYIELFKSTTAEVQQVLNRTMEPPKPRGTPPMEPHMPFPMLQPHMNPHSIMPPFMPPQPPQVPPPAMAGHGTKDCIRLRGLPYEASVTDILAFLGDYSKNIVYQGVHMVYGVSGQPSGEAFIQMDSEIAAESAALNKHKKYMPCAQMGQKKRYIEVFQCSSADMSIVLTNPEMQPMLPNLPGMPPNMQHNMPPNMLPNGMNIPGIAHNGMQGALNLTPPSMQHSPTQGSPTNVSQASPQLNPNIPFSVQQRAPLIPPVITSMHQLFPGQMPNPLVTNVIPQHNLSALPKPSAIQMQQLQQQQQLLAHLSQQPGLLTQAGLTAGQLNALGQQGAMRGAYGQAPPMLYYYPSPPLSPQGYFNPLTQQQGDVPRSANQV